MLYALTRDISPHFDRCELTHLARTPIDVGLAQAQHRSYTAALQELGCRLITLPAEPHYPDSVFVEDTAIVLDEITIITRPGAPVRRGETATIADALQPYHNQAAINAPAVLDGGDVLRLGRKLFVGLSGRSNVEAVEQLQNIVAPFGYSVQGVEVDGCLHLKSAVTQVAEDTLLINPHWVEASVFAEMTQLEIHPSEPMAANALLIDDNLIYPAHYPLTGRKLSEAGISVNVVDVSELSKAEGGVTCCSLIFGQ